MQRTESEKSPSSQGAKQWLVVDNQLKDAQSLWQSQSGLSLTIGFSLTCDSNLKFRLRSRVWRVGGYRSAAGQESGKKRSFQRAETAASERAAAPSPALSPILSGVGQTAVKLARLEDWNLDAGLPPQSCTELAAQGEQQLCISAPYPDSHYELVLNSASVNASTLSWFLDVCCRSKVSSIDMQSYLSRCRSSVLATAAKLAAKLVLPLASHCYGSFVLGHIMHLQPATRQTVTKEFCQLLAHNKERVNEFVSRCMQTCVRTEPEFCLFVTRDLNQHLGQDVISGPVLFLYLAAIREGFTYANSEYIQLLQFLQGHFSLFLALRGSQFAAQSCANSTRKLNRVMLCLCQWAPLEWFDDSLSLLTSDLVRGEQLASAQFTEALSSMVSPNVLQVWAAYCIDKRERDCLFRLTRAFKGVDLFQVMQDKFGLLCLHLLLERNHQYIWTLLARTLEVFQVSRGTASCRRISSEESHKLRILWKHMQMCKWCSTEAKQRMTGLLSSVGIVTSCAPKSRH